MLSIFLCVCWPSVCLLWRNVYLGLPPILRLSCLFFLILCCMSCLYILEINPLLVALLANIFSHSEGCLLVLFMVSFAVQKLLSLIRSHLFIFVFIFTTLGGGSEKILLWFMSKSVLPVFSSKSFIVSSLTFRSLIYFEFIFVYGVRRCSDLILLHVAVQFSQHHLLKRLSKKSFIFNLAFWLCAFAFNTFSTIFFSIRRACLILSLTHLAHRELPEAQLTCFFILDHLIRTLGLTARILLPFLCDLFISNIGHCAFSLCFLINLARGFSTFFFFFQKSISGLCCYSLLYGCFLVDWFPLLSLLFPSFCFLWVSVALTNFKDKRLGN